MQKPADASTTPTASASEKPSPKGFLFKSSC